MSAFATAQLVVTDPINMAAAFKTECVKWMNPVDCSNVAFQIETTFQGSLGKRPIALCKALGLCNSTETGACVLRANTSTTVTVTAANADACTLNGVPVFEGGRLLEDPAAVVYWAAYNGE
jgi:hypothetical protein